MNLTKFALVGAVVLTLAACHTAGHRLCDDEDRGKQVACVLLVVGAIKAVKLIALSSPGCQDCDAGPPG